MNNINKKNISPRIWGPPAWETLYNIAYSLPENPSAEIKEKYKMFFMALKYVLPCEKCSDNFQEHVEEFPLTDKQLENYLTLIQWLVNINNAVNKMLGKPLISYKAKVQEIKIRANPTFLYKFRKHIYCITIIAMLAIGFFIYRKKCKK